MAVNKGKEVAAAKTTSTSASGKRKKTMASKNNGSKKLKRPGVLKFVDDAAEDAGEEEDGSDGLDFIDDLEDDEDGVFMNDVKPGVKLGKSSGASHRLPFFLKEEDLSIEEQEQLIRERYAPGSRHVTYDTDTKEGADFHLQIMKSANIWRVKCMIGREYQIAFSLLQKFIDMHRFGNKLPLISAFALEHVKGFVFVEAAKEADVTEACKGFCTLYSSKVTHVPEDEVPRLLSAKSNAKQLSKGTWVRVKNGNYKGDLGLVVAFDDFHRRAIIKLIPRINLQALANKFGGGVSLKQGGVPPPRLISSRELEDFRPHIQIKRDRLTGEYFEILDGLMLKDGYLYKKVSIASISWLGIEPSSSELVKFEANKMDDVENLEWLSLVYGERRKTPLKDLNGKSVATEGSGYELQDLVLFGNKSFGVIIGVKGDSIQILKGDVEGSELVTILKKEIKSSCVDKMFTAPDRHKKTISINDSVRVIEGPHEGKEGIVKHMYKGTLFIYDEALTENCGFISAKSQVCENIKKSTSSKADKMGCSSSYMDVVEEPTEPTDSDNRFKRPSRVDVDSPFSIGQSVRIRVGPLKGYLGRVISIYRSNVTLKLDSLVKIMTVKCDHISEANTRTFGSSIGDASTSTSLNPFDSQMKSSDEGWGGGSSKSSWDVDLPATARDSWAGCSTSAFPAEGQNNKKEVDNGGTDPWGSKLSSRDVEQSVDVDGWGGNVASSGGDNSAWNKSCGGTTHEASDWGKDAGGWDKSDGNTDNGGSKGWENTNDMNVKIGSNEVKNGGGDPWGSKLSSQSEQQDKHAESWGGKLASSGGDNSSWNKSVGGTTEQAGAWGNDSGGWSKNGDHTGSGKKEWENPKKLNAEIGSSEGECSAWNRTTVGGTANQASHWGKDGGTWDKSSGKTGDGEKTGGSSKNWGHNKSTGGWGSSQGSLNSQGSARDTKCKDVENDNARGAAASNAKESALTNSEVWEKASQTKVSGNSDAWGVKENTCGKEADVWGEASIHNANQICDDKGGWRKTASGGWNETQISDHGESGNWSKTGSWEKPKASSGGWQQGGAESDGVDKWNKSGSSSAWSKGAAEGNFNGGWNNQEKPQHFESGRGFGQGGGGGRSSNGDWHQDNWKNSGGRQDSILGRGRGRNSYGGRQQQGNWNQPRNFNGEKQSGWQGEKHDGSGGADQDGWRRSYDFGGRGRGRGRDGGRGREVGRGRGRYQSSDWNNEDGNSRGGGSFSRNSCSWGSDQHSSWGASKSFGGNADPVGADCGGKSWSGGNSDWNSGGNGGDSNTGRGSALADTDKQLRDWGNDVSGRNWNEPKTSTASQPLWEENSSVKQSSTKDDWKTVAPSENRSSWMSDVNNSTNNANEAVEGKGSWDRPNPSDGGKGWGSSAEKSSGWKNNSSKARDGGGSWEKVEHTYGGSSWDSKSMHANPNPTAANEWKTTKPSSEDGSSAWNQKSSSQPIGDKGAGGSNWDRPKHCSEAKNSGWKNGGGWSKPNDAGGNESSGFNKSDGGRSGGRGWSGNWNRGQSTDGQSSGWSGNDSEGRGRGRGRGRGWSFNDSNSDRDMGCPQNFGGRGRSGGWGRGGGRSWGHGNDSAGDRPEGSKGSWNNGEATQKGSWNSTTSNTDWQGGGGGWGSGSGSTHKEPGDDWKKGNDNVGDAWSKEKWNAPANQTKGSNSAWGSALASAKDGNASQGKGWDNWSRNAAASGDGSRTGMGSDAWNAGKSSRASEWDQPKASDNNNKQSSWNSGSASRNENPPTKGGWGADASGNSNRNASQDAWKQEKAEPSSSEKSWGKPGGGWDKPKDGNGGW